MSYPAWPDAASTPGPRPPHPLADVGRRGVPITVLILVIWLVLRHWSVQDIVELLLVCAPGIVAAGRTGKP